MNLWVYLFSSASIIVTFSVFSYYSEVLNSNLYDGKKFNFSSFLLVFNYAYLFLATIIAKLITNKKNFSNLFNKELIIASIFSVVSLESTINLGYTLNYLFAVLFRSSKFLSLVISSLIFHKHRKDDHSSQNLGFAICTTVGLILFASGGKDSGKSELVGFFYGFLSLFADCVVSHNQSKVDRKTFDFLTLMQVMNFWNLITSIILCFGIKGEFWPAVQFIQTHNSVLLNQFLSTSCFVVGSFFIFFHLNNFGPVNLAYVTSVRKVITIFVSCILFSHSLNAMKTSGMVIIIICVIADVFGNIKKARAKPKIQ